MATHGNVPPKWMERFEETKAYLEAKRMGRTPPPHTTQLNAWMGAQRTSSKRGRLCPERRRLLDSIGFDYDPHKLAIDVQVLLEQTEDAMNRRNAQQLGGMAGQREASLDLQQQQRQPHQPTAPSPAQQLGPSQAQTVLTLFQQQQQQNLQMHMQMQAQNLQLYVQKQQIEFSQLSSVLQQPQQGLLPVTLPPPHPLTTPPPYFGVSNNPPALSGARQNVGTNNVSPAQPGTPENERRARATAGDQTAGGTSLGSNSDSLGNSNVQQSSGETDESMQGEEDGQTSGVTSIPRGNNQVGAGGVGGSGTGGGRSHDRNNTDSDNVGDEQLEEQDGDTSMNDNHVASDQETHEDTADSSRKTKVPRMVSCLGGNLQSGLASVAPAVTGVGQRNALLNKTTIDERSWDDYDGKSLSASSAIKFTHGEKISVDQARHGTDLAMEIITAVQNWRASKVMDDLFAEQPIPDEVHDGVYKVQLNTQGAKAKRIGLMDLDLPVGLQVKLKAKKKCMAFVNIKGGTCPTHYDRDISLLFLLSGRKESKLATVGSSMKNRHYDQERKSSSTIFDDVDPFDETSQKIDKFVWIDGFEMRGYDALLLPAYQVHVFKSDENAVALSFQIEAASDSKIEGK